MTTYRVSHEGDGSDPSDATWATAATTLQAALTLATTDGDIILVDKDHTGDNALAADTTYTIAADVSIICVDKDNSDALATMGTAAWIGNDTTSYSVTFAGADFSLYVYGLTIRIAGASADNITLANTAGMTSIFDSCYLWLGTTSSTARIRMAPAGASHAVARNCTFRFGSTSQMIGTGSQFEINGGSLSADGSIPSVLLESNTNRTGWIKNFDASLVSGTLLGNAGEQCHFFFENCKLHSTVVPLAAQTTNPTLGSGHITLINCSSADQHYHFNHYNAYGQTVVDTGIYASDGAAYNEAGTKYSLKITTSAYCNKDTPYVSPPIHLYNETTTAFTPYIEGFRDGSTTVIQNDEVWVRISYQGTSGFPLGVTDETDKVVLLGSPANQTSSKTYADWQTGTTADSTFKLATASDITPAEIGPLSAQVCVGEREITVYIDPQIRV